MKTCLGAYRTLSTEAAAVLAGELPLSIRAMAAAALDECLRTGRLMYGGHEFFKGDNTKASLKQALNDKSLETWQERWDVCEKGAVTKAFTPNIQACLQADVRFSPYWA